MRAFNFCLHLFGIVSMATVLTSCNGGSASTPPSSRTARSLAAGLEFLYVGEGQKIGAYTINTSSGALRKVGTSPYVCPNRCTGEIVADPAANYLYSSAINRGIHGYSIDPTTGALTPISGSPFSDPYGHASTLAIAPNGAFLYVGSFTQPYQPNSVTAYTIDAGTGALSIVRGSPYANGEVQSYATVVTPENFLYIAESGSVPEVSGFSIVPGGGLTQVSGSPFGAGLNPRRLAVAPSGAFLYVPGLGSDPSIAGTISVYAIDPSNGVLTEINGSPYTTPGGPAAVAITPSGDYAYVALAYSNEIAAFSIAPSGGGLTQINGSPFATGTEPINATVDPSGKFLYVGNVDSNSISAYKINAGDGSLTPIPRSPFSLGKHHPDDLAVAVPH
jgi:6-phosphogluconolactonase (cycloisomerase 2 family)